METAVKNIHEELIKACRENDPKAQLQIYKLYYKAMYNTALRIVNHTAEAEDVMQEAFLDAFRRIDSYRGEASFGSWLKKIVINRSIDSVKRSKEVLSLDEIDEQMPNGNGDEEDYMLVLSSRVEEIRATIHSLPDNYRIILSLHLLEGYDHEEIAQIMNINNNLSRIRFFRAKKKLLELLSEKHQDGSYYKSN